MRVHYGVRLQVALWVGGYRFMCNVGLLFMACIYFNDIYQSCIYGKNGSLVF